MSKYQNNRVRGLPGELPEGERVLWQGSPDWREFAVRVFHTRFVAGYFGLLFAWTVFASFWEGGTLASGLSSGVWSLVGGALALAVLYGLAWLFARTTIYTLTNKRIAMHYGVALPMTINIPLRCVDSAGLRVYPRGTGDIPFALKGPDRFAYLHLWPNARPWRYAKAEPMMRAIPDVEDGAQIIARALVAAQQAEEAKETAPALKQVRTGAKARKTRKPQPAAAQPLPAAE
ncbi:photosynthetic complex putative assembly protein PuhB [Dichotomicrobium thermohalophilum]|uniref:PH (Pleckstrin Homology) domain-containing protein n=1 Tax=Dichotomicrobium thermohalophilum TaxID=933063 RepID=A0A397QF98_9HYPH|nr:photosynthetic complex putative assembly protein PuhB [Dichotomicrobium thermohalophilum]RIA56724.1 PH (Pleckstrin Homology) domain-containing protein [Dichotomicrobium thermohalophilum]